MSNNENQQPEEEAGKLFVGGLSWDTSKESLSNYFSKFGEVTDCVVMKNTESGKSRGFGFITFSDPSAAEEVMSKALHQLDSRTIDPKPCTPRSMQLKKKDSTYKIFLGGLPNNISESDIQTFFSNYGNVTEVVIMYDAEKQKCRGFGFLSFDTLDAVTKACDDHFVHIKGKQVECKRAQTGTNQNRGMQQGMGNNRGASWNQMGGPMPNNGMGGPTSGYQGWGNNQGGGFNQQNPSGNGGLQNYSYGNNQPNGGQQGYNNGGNFNSMPGPNGPQGGNNGGGLAFNMAGPPMGQNQMGSNGMKDNSSYGNNYGNMGNYSHDSSNFGPNKGFGGPMGLNGMNNSGYMHQGGFNNQSRSFDNMGGHGNMGGQNDGTLGGRWGAQQNQGYHPYKR